MNISWSDTFVRHFQFGQIVTGATETKLAELSARIRAPLSPERRARIQAQMSINPYPVGHPWRESWKPDPIGSWALPEKPLPGDYLSLLRWCAGDHLINRHGRHFQFFDLDPNSPIEVVAMNDAYGIPRYMPGALAFAMDGGGWHYVFDMRADPSPTGDYPVLLAQSGNLGFEDAEYLAASFTIACDLP